MRVLITGAAGFIGQLLAKAMLDDEDGRYTVVLTDVIEPPIPKNVKWPQKATSIRADLVNESDSVVDKELEAVYMFHGIMSSGAEANFELGFKVNFDATRKLLDSIRKNTAPGIVRVIYTSSQAVYGGKLHEPIDETMRPTPESSYGCEKVMCEYLITDLSRRGFIQGLNLRLPTVSVRPGTPTAAASSFLSGIIREPLQNKKCVIPLTDRSFSHWLCSPRILTQNLLHSLALPNDALPSYDRVLNLPGIGVTVQGMMDSLARVGGKDKLDLVEEKDDETLKPILYSWPTKFDNSVALGLGFHRDNSFDDIVKDFKESLSSV